MFWSFNFYKIQNTSNVNIKLFTHHKNFLNYCFIYLLTSSIIKEINPEYSLEGLMLNLKLQFFGYLMRRDNSLEKTLMLGKIEGKKKRAWQRVRSLNGITDSMDEFEQTLGNREGQGSLACCQSMGFQRMRPDLATEQQHLLQSFGRYIYFCHLVHQWNTHN